MRHLRLVDVVRAIVGGLLLVATIALGYVTLRVVGCIGLRVELAGRLVGQE